MSTTSKMTPTIVLYGIPNCDAVKKARLWLSDHALAYQFHDFKKQGVPPQQLATWMVALGWEKLLNRKGTTWRKLDPVTQAAVIDAANAADLMLSQPSLIKRPVVEWGDSRKSNGITVGFDAQAWAERLCSD